MAIGMGAIGAFTNSAVVAVLWWWLGDAPVATLVCRIGDDYVVAGSAPEVSFYRDPVHLLFGVTRDIHSPK